MREHREFEECRTEKQDKRYRITITDVTDGEKEVATEELASICLVGSGLDGTSMCEIVLNENIMGIAAMLHAGSKTRHAVRLATLVENMHKDDAREQANALEDMLTEMFNPTEGGVQ
ncbi:MAG: hypothetical protein K6F61_04025 [Clostridiales bacterium]|nr:hypothetical protein [Clostridiales bacterium]